MRVTLAHPFLLYACFNTAVILNWDGSLVMRVLQLGKVAPWRHTRKVRGIAVLTLYLGAGWGLGGHARPLYLLEIAPVAIVEEASAGLDG